MSRFYPDTRYAAPGVPTVGYWTPDTPGFIENRESRIAASRKNNASYEEARKDNRNKIVQWGDAPAQIDDRPFYGAREPLRSRYGASIIDFSKIGASAMRDGVFPQDENPFDAPFQDDVRDARVARPSQSRASRPPRDRAFSVAHESIRRRGAYVGGNADGARFVLSPSRSGGLSAEFLTQGNREPAPSRTSDGGEDDWQRPSFGDGLQRKRHARRHRKAERAFERAYGDEWEQAQTGSSPDEPRAALYETKMGRTHQRAARMQLEKRGVGALAATGNVAAALSAFSLDALTKHRWFSWASLTLIVMLLVAFLLYPAAQDYYLQSRENDKLAAEYQAVLDHNTALGEQVAALQTDEGMEQLAHESLGWVREGENSVSVADASSSSSDSEASSDSAVSDAESVATPSTWYSPVLDIVFGYKDDVGSE